MISQYSKELIVIVVAQFFCTSVWFASNAVAPEIILALSLEGSAQAHMTSAVQFGFISGTLIFSVLAIADRFSPSKVFMICALLAAILNAGVVFATNLQTVLLFRFLTGFSLAGIYPVGMKIASDYFEKGLGKSLGWLVGALVLGTALPHLFRAISVDIDWTYIVYSTSALSCLGGICMFLFVADGPFRRVSGSIKLSAFLDGFKSKDFRASAFGYFGHMWELYAFWAFVPVIWKSYIEVHRESTLNVSYLSFAVIGVGGLACMVSGFLSQKFTAQKVATLALMGSGLCCLLSPFVFSLSPTSAIVFMVLWGLLVVADSPMFSSLVAQHAPPHSRGTALTTVTCIGFAITIVSIQILSVLSTSMNSNFIYLILAPGPIIGVLAMLRRA